MKFTKEFIAQERERSRTFSVLTHAEKVAQAALDEIERLQAENDLLQTNCMCLNRDLEKAQLHAQELQQEKIFFQELSNNWSKRYYKVIDEQRNRIALLEQAKEMMEAEIKESNGLLRSAFMIAKRDGNKTNWEAWRKQLHIALERQHAMMYKQQESDEMKFTKDDIENIKQELNVFPQDNSVTVSKSMILFLVNEISRLQSENNWYKEKNLEWQKKYDTDTEKLRARIQELEEEKQAVWKEWLEKIEKRWDEEDKQERQWISISNLEKDGIYAYIDYRNGNGVAYFRAINKIRYQRNHIEFLFPLPQPPQEEE